MPVNFVELRNPYAEAITLGTQGFLQGRKLRQDNEDRTIANAYRNAQMQEIQRKTQALNAPIEDPNYFRDPYSGSLQKRTVKIGSMNGGGSPKNLQATRYDAYGNPTSFKDMDAELDLIRQKEVAKGIPTSEAGRITLANESLASIPKVKETLFPKGDASEFDRETLVGANPPGLNLPFGLGRVSLPVRPDNPFDRKDDLKAQKAQNVHRQLGSALAARQLIQTGVSASPGEYGRLIAQFFPDALSNPQAALDALNQLEQFYGDYTQTVATRSAPKATLPKIENTTSSSNSIDAEAQAAIAAGADPQAVMARVNQLKNRR